MRRVFILLVLVVLSVRPIRSYGQDSMIPEVSYLFLEKLIATAKENLPQTKINESLLKISKAGVSKARLSWLDPLSFSYYGRINDNNQPINPALYGAYQFGISMSPAALIQKPMIVRQAKENLKIVEYQQKQYELNLETQIKNQYFTYVQQILMVHVASKAFLDAESLYKTAKVKYERGEITFEAYTNALTAYTSAAGAKIGAEAAMLSAKAELEGLVGKKLDEIK